MKKVLLLSLGLILGLSAFAQTRVSQAKAKTSKEMRDQMTTVQVKSDVGTEMAPTMSYTPSNTVLPSVQNSRIVREDQEAFEESTMITDYDLQSNSAVGNRIAAWPDGTAAIVATWDQGYDNGSYPVRGTGYNYCDGEEWGDFPEDRVECAANGFNQYSGWPSICAYGDGEILASHGGGNVNIMYRATKGEGNWTKIASITGATWPRIVCTEDGTLHLICADQDSNNTKLNYVWYYRSTDGGYTWTEVEYIANLEEEYQNKLGADDYVMAANGNRVAIMFSSQQYDIFYVISEDSGLTWTKQVIAEFPYPDYDADVNWNGGNPIISNLTDTIDWSDNSHSIAIDNDGTVHAVWGMMAWAPSSDQEGYISIWTFRNTDIVYWNSNYTNEQGGHNIPNFGDWSGDAAHPEWANNGEGGKSGTLRYDRLIEMCWDETSGDLVINPNLNVFGWASELNPGQPADWGDYYNNSWGWYRSYGVSTMPGVAAAANGNVAVIYSQLSDYRVGEGTDGTFYKRSAFVHQRINGEWLEPNTEWSITNANYVMHMNFEVYPTFALDHDVAGNYWFGYSEDREFGLFMDDDQSEITDNWIWAVRISADYDDVAETKDVVYNIYPNPASDYICISADANADATITFVNLAGQTVKSINQSLVLGENIVNIDLASGVYFCTVNANGFSKTTKVVVK